MTSQINMHADHRRYPRYFQSKWLTILEIALRHDKLPTTVENWISHGPHRADLRTRRKVRKRKSNRANIRARQAENYQLYRQTDGRLILPSVYFSPFPHHPLQYDEEGCVRSHLGGGEEEVINNILRLVFPRKAIGTRWQRGTREVRVWEVKRKWEISSFLYHANERIDPVRRCAEHRGHRWKYPIYMQIPYLSPWEAATVGAVPRRAT